MAWKIEFDANVLKDLKKIDRAAQKRILKFLKKKVATTDNPRFSGKPLKGHHHNLWRYRIGNYRVVTKIEDDKLVVLVVAIGHRQYVYQLI